MFYISHHNSISDVRKKFEGWVWLVKLASVYSLAQILVYRKWAILNLLIFLLSILNSWNIFLIEPFQQALQKVHNVDLEMIISILQPRNWGSERADA